MNMKKKRFIFPGIAAALLLAGLLWWTTPVTFLGGVAAGEVASIEVFDGNTGAAFSIVSRQEIEFIVSNIQQAEMQREKVSLGYMGTRFRLTFCDSAGRPLESFIVNSVNTIRKDPFFYRDPAGGLCAEYLASLES